MGERDLLFEIGAEEIPALSVDIGIAQLKEEAIALLGRNRLGFDSLDTFGSPRRLTLLVRDLAEKQTEEIVEVKGPPRAAAYDEEGNPTKAAEGFASSQGVTLVDLIVKEEEGREYVYAVKHEIGRRTTDLLPGILTELVASLTFPKSMRWGSGEIRFVRPIRWLLSLFGDEIVEFSMDGLTSSNLTYGHRFLADNPIIVTDPDDYFRLLEAGHVIVDRDRRSAMIREAIVEAPWEAGGRAVIDGTTLKEVVNLVEYPNVILASFAKEFVKLPRDVLTTAMESHQRYFPVEDEGGDILHHFIVVHNGDPKEDELIRRGHERVIRARLADARFFFAEDMKRPLEDYVENLKGVVFQEKLGTVYEKIERIRKLSGRIAEMLGLTARTVEKVKRAAFLSKADLTTEMVVEFPSLQGAMGREYARLSGEPEEVARAIFEHYMPRSAADAFPASVEGQVVAFADKLDTVVGTLAVGHIPTGSEDPYALRRAAYGLIGIAINGVWRLSISKVVGEAVDLYREQGVSFDEVAAYGVILDFVMSRFRAYLISKGIAYDAVDAVLAIGVDDLVDAVTRATILDAERESTEMANLLFAFNRAKNLARPELGVEADGSLFVEEVERELYKTLLEVEKALDKKIKAGNYAAAVKKLAELRAPIDAYFDGVLVMAEEIDLRENRLKLLNRARTDFLRVADFSKLVTPGA
ncbi:MAG: glycine--tRNA ligase subunit beta [Actinobacteria bacterium]|nr:glycine--tRNA ligase subunit beta [Actinomycetota bacterium]